MSMIPDRLRAFASFSDDDDKNSEKYISGRFCFALEREVRTQSGEQDFNLFRFTASIGHGVEWRREVDEWLET